jgi:hypothetical protein
LLLLACVPVYLWIARRRRMNAAAAKLAPPEAPL